MTLELQQINPNHAAAGGQLVLLGEDFAASTHVFFRRHKESDWSEVDPSRVNLDNGDLIVEIDEDNSDGWPAGLCDVGVAATGDPLPTAPTSWLAQTVFFYLVRPYNPEAVIKGVPRGLYIDGEFVGHLNGELEIEHEVETSDIVVNESHLPVRSIKSGESFTLTAPLAEVTLENLRRVWGIAGAIQELGGGRRRVTFGGDLALREKPVMIVLPAGSGLEWAVTFYRTVITSPGALTWGKDEQVNLPLRVTVLADTSRPVGDQVLRVEEYPAEVAADEEENGEED